MARKLKFVVKNKLQSLKIKAQRKNDPTPTPINHGEKKEFDDVVGDNHLHVWLDGPTTPPEKTSIKVSTDILNKDCDMHIVLKSVDENGNEQGGFWRVTNLSTGIGCRPETTVNITVGKEE